MRVWIVLLTTIAGLSSVHCGEPDPSTAPWVLTMTVEVPAGDEQIRCQYIPVPPGGIDAAGFSHRYTPGSHHLLLYPTDLSADAAPREPFDCLSRGDLHQVGVAYGGSEPEGSQEFPPGVAMELAAGSVVLLESHYLNASDTPLTGNVELVVYPSTVPVTVHAGTLFFYDWAILVPPSPATGVARMQCAIDTDIELQFASSHMHRRGTEFHSTLIGDGTQIPLHSTTDWATPEASVFDPPLQVHAGQRVELECRYQNDRPHEVIEGESADRDEMCIFTASYWPRLDPASEACLGRGSAPVLAGDRTCAETVACLDTTTDPTAIQHCLHATCAGSAGALTELIGCIEFEHCGDDPQCIATQCLAPWSACETATCD
jgi:hypothetical protein